MTTNFEELEKMMTEAAVDSGGDPEMKQSLLLTRDFAKCISESCFKNKLRTKGSVADGMRITTEAYIRSFVTCFALNFKCGSEQIIAETVSELFTMTMKRRLATFATIRPDRTEAAE
jgi:hypothetical protein